MKLITEHTTEVEYIVEEGEKKEKQQYIKGIFMQSDIKNQNGRVYPFAVLQKQVKKRGIKLDKRNNRKTLISLLQK